VKRHEQINHPFVGVIAKESYPHQEVFKPYPLVKSVVVALFPYSNQNKLAPKGTYLPAKMFYGRDYHLVVKDKLQEFVVKWELPDAVIGVDTSPLDERLCAYLAGLGTFGDHNLLINPTLGTFFAIGTIMTSAVFHEYQQPIAELCTHCGACLKACPTQALTGGFHKERCLSNLSQKASSDFSLYDLMHHTCYGCDLCQDACFYNSHPDYSLPELAWDGLSVLTWEGFLQLDAKQYFDYYRDKSWSWIAYERMLRNLMVLRHHDQALSEQEVIQLATKTTKPWFLKHLQYLRGQHGKS